MLNFKMDSEVFCQGCVYLNCNNLKNTSDGISFFAFPVKDEARCKQWLINCGNIHLFDLEEQKLKNRVICELHFEPKYIIYSGKRKHLTRNAVPKSYKGKMAFI